MDTINKNYLDALCAMSEDDFTKDILKPLFEAMGYDRVEFNGGPYEKGRDLIAHKKNPPRKEMKVTYVQSKKIGNIQSTSTSVKFTTLCHQLRQCCAGEIMTMSGVKVSPEEVFLACPEQITNRFFEEVQDQLLGVPDKVYPYDGVQILSDIREYKPDLLDLLSTVEEKITSNSSLVKSNSELLSALQSDNQVNQDEFYNDLSFFVGSFDSNNLLHLKIIFEENSIYVDESLWPGVKNKLSVFVGKHDINLFVKDLALVEQEYEDLYSIYESEDNKEKMKRYDKLVERIKNESADISLKINILKKSAESIKGNGTINISDDELDSRKEAVSYLTSIYDQFDGASKKVFNLADKKDTHFYEEVNDLYERIFEKSKLEDEVINLKHEIVDKPRYIVNIDCEEVCNKLEYYRGRYLNDVTLINENKLDINGIKNFLSDTEKTLSFVSQLVNNEFPLSEIITVDKEVLSEDRVSISPHDIFYSGHDIAVYGSAGAGKTTTLNAYAEKLLNDESVVFVYVPLNRMVDKLKDMISEMYGQNIDPNTDYKKAKKNEEHGGKSYIYDDLLVKIILLSKGVTPTKENIEDSIRHLNGPITLILDGLDEIYNVVPQILDAISKYKKSNSDAQFIVSSRDCVSYLNDINFLGITLLPFTKDQLYRFIRGWLSDSDKSESLIRSIKKRDLYEHIKTPLLATITCALVSQGVNAPSTETEIYSERIRLLTGEYDLHKKIDRQKNKGKMLIICARKIAYYMHSISVRSLEKEKMFNALLTTLSKKYSADLLASCLDELIDPCNILYKDPISDSYSFGHFRFQEHLASEELRQNRSIDLTELVIADWWRGALSLYAQDNEFAYLIEDTYMKYGHIRKAKMTLTAMINSCPTSKRSNLMDLLHRYEEADQLESMILDVDDYNYVS